MFMVMQTGEWEIGSFKRGWGGSYRFACSCGEPDHDGTVMFTADDGIVQMHLYKNVDWADRWKKDWWHQRMWLRIKAAVKIIFTGYIEMEDDMTLRKEQLPDLIKTFQDCLIHIENIEKQIQSEPGAVAVPKSDTATPPQAPEKQGV